MKYTIAAILLALAYQVQAQRTLTYRLDGAFVEADAAAPALDTIGDGQFVADTLVEVDDLERVSYRFDRGSGIAFDNGEAGDFLGETYSIELYFRFDDLASWRRIIDYKNRQTDFGLYAKDGRINFYNITTSPEAPLARREYAHVIVTRNADDDDRYAIYVDGELAASFEDRNGDGLLGEANDSLVFFRDDLVVGNETSAGNVALIKLYDYALDSTATRRRFIDLGTGLRPTAVREPIADLSAAYVLYPNPTQDVLRVRYRGGAEPEAPHQLRVLLLDVAGRHITEAPYGRGLDVSGLPAGAYRVLLRDAGGLRGRAGWVTKP